MIIDCVGDLHGNYPQTKGGDLLILSGDYTARDSQSEYLEWRKWLIAQDYRKKIFICGNHDGLIENGHFYFNQDWLGAEWLSDSGTEFEGLKIWGSPWTLRFKGMNPHCMAYTVDTEEQLAKKWALIPDDIDILVTHSPTFGLLDRIVNHEGFLDEHVGSTSLLSWNSNHVNTCKLHVFGHIHESYGVWDVRKPQKELGDPISTVYVNASHVNERYQPVNKPIRIDL